MILFSWIQALLAKLQGPDVAARAAQGPAPDEHPPVSAFQVSRVNNGKTDGAPAPWIRGAWTKATQTPAHTGRVGGTILPRAIVVHTTDMHPSQFGALRKAWQERPGDGACAHFVIGRDATQGVLQFVSITRNGNHAGGNPHGWWRSPPVNPRTDGNGTLYHPNTVAVGIELHAAGQLKPTGKPGEYRHPDSGLLVPASEVELDAKGRPWHKVTPYQYAILRDLINDLMPLLGAWERGTAVKPDDTYESQGVPWAATPSIDVVGHVTLDPVNRNDPGPFVMEWLRQGSW